MKKSATLLPMIIYAAVIPCFSLPAPVGQWDFNNSSNPTAATTGNALALQGNHTVIPGPDSDAGAVRIGVGSYYTLTHGIAPNGGGTKVNEYTLTMDIRIAAGGQWHSLLQTTSANTDDADCFINPTSQVGVSATGYSSLIVKAAQWYRLTIVVDNGSRYEIYLNGELILNGTVPAVDGRYALDPTALLFADNDGEDNDIEVAKVALYSSSLSAAQVDSLGGFVVPVVHELLTGPYLQNVKTTGMTIMWEMDAPENGHVEYGATTGYGSTQAATSFPSGAATNIYKAVISGLIPGTQYHYRVVTDSITCADATFTTAPSSSIDFSFGVWADSQGGSSATSPMMQHMADVSKVNLAIAAGDMSEVGNQYGYVRSFFLDRPIKYLAPKAPVFFAWGLNHDLGEGSLIRNFTDLPSKDRIGRTAGYGSYSFEYAGCHFACIDGAESLTDALSWLSTDLSSTAAQNARFRFVFIHVPPYCERWIDGDAALRADLVPILEANKVDIVFSGHTHEYERGQQNGVYYCITGGGSWLDSGEPVVHDWPFMTVGGAQNLSPTITGGLVNEYVKVDIKGSTMTAKLMAFSSSGSFLGVLDSFTQESPVGINHSAKPDFQQQQKFDYSTSAQGLFIYSGSNEVYAVTITDMRGIVVLRQQGITTARLHIDRSKLAAGTYLVAMQTRARCTVNLISLAGLPYRAQR